MTPPRLFDVGDVADQPVELLSADRRRTQAQRQLLALGIHPATRERTLDPAWGFTCGDCAHAHAHSHGDHRRRWWKCRLHRLGFSFSASSDIRVSWPACNRYRLDPERSR